MKTASLALLAGVSLCSCASLIGQVITSPVSIQLTPRPLGSGQYKYGIYASMGGSTTPQLYELDTGGTGFWPVYGTGEYATPAWGEDVIATGQNISISYDSGNVYSAEAVLASVSLFSALDNGQPSATPAFTSGALLLGQTDTITNTKGNDSSGSWPSASPPVDGHFYGDFGLSLVAATNGAFNILAQLDYGPDVLPGFVIRLGYPGNPRATLQVGLDPNYADEFPLRFTMSGQNTDVLFPGTDIPTYGEGLLEATLVLNNTEHGENNFPVMVVLDTGASPNIHYSDASPAALFDYLGTDTNGKEHVSKDTQLTLLADDTGAFLQQLLQVITGDGPGQLHVGAQEGGMFYDGYYFNIGQELYYHYEVAYDLRNGIIAFRPIPEPMAAGALALIALAMVSLRRRLIK